MNMTLIDKDGNVIATIPRDNVEEELTDDDLWELADMMMKWLPNVAVVQFVKTTSFLREYSRAIV